MPPAMSLLSAAAATPFDVLVVLPSADGTAALAAILIDLPTDLSASVLIGASFGEPAAIIGELQRHTSLPVHWAQQGTVLQPGHIYVSPPQLILEVKLGGRCALTPPVGELASERPLDQLLASLAVSFGARTLAVMLAGLGADGRLGARALRGAGGLVVAQAPGSADTHHEAETAALVQTLEGLGRTAADLLTGQPPRPLLNGERWLPSSADALQTVLEGIDDFFYALDADWRLLFASRSALDQWGKQGADVLGQPFLQAFPQAAGSAAYEAHERVMQTRTPERLETVSPVLGRWIEIHLMPTPQGGLSVAFRDIQARKQAEQRQAFLLKLSDALRPLTGSAEMEGTAVRLLGQELGANRVFYATVDPGGDFWSVQHDYADGVPSCAGRFPMSDFQRGRLAQWQAGQLSSVADSDTAPTLSAADRAAYAAFDTRAVIGVPLVKGGRFAALLSVNQTRPRDWSEAEIALTLEVAERTWVAIERARAEEALHRSEEQLRAVLDSMAEGFALLGDDFTILDVNEETLRLDGRSREELIGRTHWEVFPGTENSPVGELLRRVAQQRTPDSLEHEYRWPDRQSRWLEMRAYPMQDTGVAIFWSDVTDRKRAEEAMRASEEKYRTLFESIDEGLCVMELVLDESGQVADLCYRETNAAFEHQTGLRAAVDKRASELFPQLESHWLEAVTRVYRTGVSERTEGYNADMRRWITTQYSRVGSQGSPFVAAVFNDITARKVAEKRQAYLLDLSDVLRPLTEPLLIQREASRLLRTHLGASRVGYGEASGEGMTYTVMAEDVAGGLDPLLGQTFSWAGVGSSGLEALLEGRLITCEDVQAAEDLTPEQKEALAAAGCRAFMVAPLMKAGQLAACLVVHFEAPHSSAPGATMLLEETAERTWTAAQRARVEEALTESESRLRALVEHLPGGAVFVVNHDLQYVLAQGEALIAAGVTPEDLVGRSVAQAMPPELVADYEMRYRQALAGESFEVEHTAHGRAFITRGVPLRTPSGRISTALAVSYDITDRQQAEEALRQSEARLAAIFEVLPVGVGFTDTAGTLRLSNQELHRFLPTGLLPSLDPERQARWIGFGAEGQRVEPHNFPGARALRGEKVVPGIDMLYTLDDGTQIWTQVSAVPLRDAGGHITGQVHVVTDVNALKRAEEELRALNTGLEERIEERTRRLADLNAELGALITRTARNLEAPVGYFSQFLDPGRAEELLTELSPQVLSALQDELARLRGVAQDLRQLARLEDQDLNRELVPLRELFNELNVTAAAVRPAEWLIQPLPIVRADRALLTQALTVLLTFTLSDTRGARYVDVTSQEVEGEVWVTVQDDGVGLSGEEAATLFDLAVRTEQTVPLLDGGGLVQVRRIMARHGGWAWAESRLNGGRVVLAFPRDETVTDLESFLRGDAPGS
ncbi:PAS domain S-box protein [Deinococcus sp. HMF7620]|uniref:histidine kinase n=2 Tax=Deinococcus arboris TaxID=2682977 RepID=A0A7C9HRQ7_9DEIO|nr:PAS domain S-box protein [Deinococcus arboris]